MKLTGGKIKVQIHTYDNFLFFKIEKIIVFREEDNTVLMPSDNRGSSPES